jgi:hypothetical protein
MINQPSQPTIPPCPQCGGQRIGTECPQEMQLLRSTSFSLHSVSGLKALVCLACGYTMLYAENLPKIQEAVRKHPEGFKY